MSLKESLSAKKFYKAIFAVDTLPIIWYNKVKKICLEGIMEYVSVAKMAEKWGLSERSVRNYCAHGRIADAKLIDRKSVV